MKKLTLLFGMIFFASFAMAQIDETWIDLDGSNDFLDFGTDNILAGQTQFTVEMRIHFDSSTGDYTIIGQRTADNNRTLVLQRWAGAFYVFLSNSNWGYCSFIPCEAYIYHLAIVFDGTGASNSDRLKLYINGDLQTLTFNGTIDAASYVTSPAANLVLGCEDNGAANQLQFVDGQLGEFCIWNYPLSSSEISNRVSSEVNGTESGLVEYFHFDDGVPGGNNTGITSFTGGNGVCTITPTNMTMNGASSNFVGTPSLASPVDASVSVSAAMITANASGATYQWLDCNNGFAILPGEISQSYTATVNGSYAVQVTEGSCTDTSACVPITILGMTSPETGSILIYPNPVMNELVIENKENEKILYVELLNTMGEVVYSNTCIEKAMIPTSDFASGIYLLKIKSGDTFELKKIVKN